MEHISNYARAVEGTNRWLVVIIAALFLSGCAKGAITKVELDPTQPRVCDTAVTPNVCGVPSNQPVWFNVRGKGNCSTVFVRCGNGLAAVPWGNQHDFGEPPTDSPLRVECDYDMSWPGPKIVKAYSNGQDCKGEATLGVRVMKVTSANPNPHAYYQIGLQTGYGTNLPLCTTVPGINQHLRPGALVSTKTTNFDPNVVINFGCLLSRCVYDPEGEPGSSAPSSFPFPGKRKYSLVLRVGNESFQGGTGVTNNDYRIQQASGPLEVCFNDDRLDDNIGQWQTIISVDETQSP